MKKASFVTGALVFSFSFLIVFFAPQALAQQRFTGATAVDLRMIESVAEGDIISVSPRGYGKSRSAYDPGVVGVVVAKPAITIGVQEATAQARLRRPIVTSGEVYVKVSTTNGAISGGDPITTSPIAGVGMKATRSGYGIGIALGSYSNPNPNTPGIIKANLQIRYFAASGATNIPSALKDVFNLSLLASYEQPLVVFKYIIAALIIITSFLLGFFYFGRVAKSGIDALGRNPLAARAIQVGIFVNVFMAIVVVALGVFLAFLVLRF